MIENYYFLLLILLLLWLEFLVSFSSIWEFKILNSYCYSLDFTLYFDKFGILFLMTVIAIYMMVFVYSHTYLKSEIFLTRFLSILFTFVSSMMMLILSGNLFCSLIGWDGLGVSSLFLILFYYSSSSLKASVLTFLMNRIGDCFFILLLVNTLILSLSSFSFNMNSQQTVLSILLLLTSITKSAQIPFSTWLPAAMEAPTPVSALVHSSTLVTAGIFMLFRYHFIWKNYSVSIILMVLSMSTCLMAGLSAMVESDLKKLIALSTLSQLGFIMFSLSMNQLSQGYFHMIMHAFFKALLFMVAGYVIHSFNGNQNIYLMSLSKSQNPLLMMIMSVSLLSMMGLPFMSGFYSKDEILDVLKSTSWSYIIFYLLVMSFMLTAMYSIRIIWYLLNGSMSWMSMSDSDTGMIKPMIPMAIASCLTGSAASWLLLEMNLYVNSSKTLVLMTILISVILYLSLSEKYGSWFMSKKWFMENFNKVYSNIFLGLTKSYKESSDTLGLPELANKGLFYNLNITSMMHSKLEEVFFNNLEFMLFLLGVILLL